MESGSGRLAEAGDVAGIGRDFGFYEDHVKHGIESGRGLAKCQEKRRVSRRGAGSAGVVVPRGTVGVRGS